MNLSENAARGRKTAAAAAAICSVISVLSLLAFNIISVVLGLGAARPLKRGSIIARDLCIMLRIADIPLLAAVLIVTHSFSGENVFKLCFIAAVLVAAFDMVIIVSLTSADANAYFQEVYEWQQLQQEQAKQPQPVIHNEMTELLMQTELPAASVQEGTAAFPGQAAAQEFTEQAVQHESPEETGVPGFSGQPLSYEQFRESIASGSAENEDTVILSDEDKLL